MDRHVTSVVEMPMGQLKRGILRMSDVYILDCYTDIFVW